jgi:DNA-binding NarL/FixJ family response regulator
VEPVRVLVVDDQEPFRRACGAVLEALDEFTLVGVGESGEASVELVQELTPDLVLMDINLPGISGLEATRIVRQLERPPVVVLVSTYDRSEYGDEPAECGASAYLSKSAFDAGLLLSTWEQIRG